MSDFPAVVDAPNRPCVSTFDAECEVGFTQTLLSIAGAAGTITQNLGYFLPVRITATRTFVRMAVFNGATVNGNIDLGIYNFNGTRLVSSGAILQAGASATQAVTIASTTLTPGVYFFAFSSSSATATILRNPSGAATLTRVCGLYTMAAAHVLPATATFAASTQANVPYIVASELTTI